jgi:hypothetical protein
MALAIDQQRFSWRVNALFINLCPIRISSDLWQRGGEGARNCRYCAEGGFDSGFESADVVMSALASPVRLPALKRSREPLKPNCTCSRRVLWQLGRAFVAKARLAEVALRFEQIRLAYQQAGGQFRAAPAILRRRLWLRQPPSPSPWLRKFSAGCHCQYAAELRRPRFEQGRDGCHRPIRLSEHDWYARLPAPAAVAMDSGPQHPA